MINLKNENETVILGKIIAENIQEGLIIALLGDLGSGKTTIAKSIINALTEEENIPSPTFNIVNEYKTEDITIYHFDFYRLEDENELYGIGFDDYISNKKAVIIIEWADKFDKVLPKNHIKLIFEKFEDSRNVHIYSNGRKYAAVTENIINIANMQLS